ncbi:MAG: acylphosphatase [Planctomycetes bacterium]|nr:acylphosphatase [Planctomycetota bacterium]
MKVCKRVYYTGRVQGVGFRYTAQHLAEQAGVTGYVRNLPTGEVELVVEGLPAQVEDFLAAVSQSMTGNIKDTRVQDEPPGGYSRFSIRH